MKNSNVKRKKKNEWNVNSKKKRKKNTGNKKRNWMPLKPRNENARGKLKNGKLVKGKNCVNDKWINKAEIVLQTLKEVNGDVEEIAIAVIVIVVAIETKDLMIGDDLDLMMNDPVVLGEVAAAAVDHPGEKGRR